MFAALSLREGSGLGAEFDIFCTTAFLLKVLEHLATMAL